MKIVIVVHNLTGGGAERVAALWANGLSGRGHQVTVAVYDDKSPDTYALSEKVDKICIASDKKCRISRIFERILRQRMVLRKIEPDLIIDVIPSFEKIISRMGKGFYSISTEHNSFERPENAEFKLEWFRKFWVNRLYNHVTVLTQADKDLAEKRLKHVTVLPNPLALEPVSSVPPKEKTVLAVGRKDAWHYKGFDLLIRAWAKISADVVGWKLQIVGGSRGGGQAYLERLRSELGVSDTVEFPEYQDNIRPYYQQASIFVLSSRYEGFGLVLIEAMSQGCACIACDFKGRQSEIITNGVDGVTCDPDNVDVLAKEMQALIDDNERRVRLQSSAILRARDFSLDKVMDRWEEIFKKCKLK